MAIAFNCPQCSVSIAVPDDASGKKGTCPACRVQVIVPAIAIPDTAAPGSPVPPVIPPETSALNEFMAPGNPLPVAAVPVPPLFDPAAPVSGTSVSPASRTPSSPFSDISTQPPVAPVDGGFPAGPVMELPQSSIAARTRRRQKKKWSGKIMAVLCAVILSAGVAWLYSHAGPDLNRDREAQSAPDTKLPAKVISNAQIGVPEEVRRAVLLYFEENKERLRSQLIEIEFSASSAGLEVSLLAGTQSMLYRVPIDSDLREWYDDHFTELQRPRMRMLEQSISNFFKGWDVAIRNQTNIEDFQSYRNSVGLTALVGALGYHLTAIVANDKYPCVYEDRNAVYFLLPRGTRRFQVTGTEIDERLSGFPGTFQVQVQSGKKKTDSESAAKTTPAPDDSGAETDPPGK